MTITPEMLAEAYAMNTASLRRRSQAVYLACDEGVAKDISAALIWAADEIERLERLVPRV